MKSPISVVLTETSIAILSKNSLLTSIPLRQWTTTDGATWSSRLRPCYQIDWLIGRLRATLHTDGPDSLMRRISRVKSEAAPPPPPKKKQKTQSGGEMKSTAMTVRKAVRKSPVALYMVGTKRPSPRTERVGPALLTRAIMRSQSAGNIILYCIN